MSLWTDFTRRLEDTLQRESVFDGGSLWQLTHEAPCRLSLRSADCPSFGADVEFEPESNRVECVFRPCGTVRVFELRHWVDVALRREAGVSRVRPKELAASLIDLACFEGKDEPACR